MKLLKKIVKILGIAIGVLALLIGALAVYNQIALRSEAEQIIPNGQMIDLGDYSVHVYSEGDNANAPTLVFLSGSATVAPVYDFKVLYRLLSDEYRIAVVEKAGYGYSDIVEVKRDIASMVNEVRNALLRANIDGPYVLLPHSMSGLEAIYWAQNFPDEVSGIVGIDMAVPYSYDDFNNGKVDQSIMWGGLSVKLGFHRIPGIYPLNEKSLDNTEARQQKLLMYRNAVNLDYIAEVNAVYENAQTVKAGGAISCPIMLFASDGTETGEAWILAQEKYAEENNAVITYFDCGHYLHYYKSDEMASSIKRFLIEFLQKQYGKIESL